MYAARTTLLLAAALCASSFVVSAQQLRTAGTLPRGNVRTLVLEFESPDSTYLGTTIARLIAAELSNSMRDMDGARARVGRMQDDRPSVNEGAVEELALRNRAVLAVWGSYFFDGDSVSVVTHARIVPVAPLTARDFALVYQTQQGELVARIPSRQINFSPVVYSRAELDAAYAADVAGYSVRKEADDASPEVAKVTTSQDLTFLSRGNGWAQVRVDSTVTGWIRVPQPIIKGAERSAGPCLLVGGLSQFAAGDYKSAENAFLSYINTAGREQDMFNVGTTRLLIGKARIHAMNASGSLPKDEAVSAEFERAAAALPESAAPVEHLAITRLMRFKGSPDDARIEGLKTSEREMITALREDPDSVSVNNLRVFYAIAADEKFLKSSGTDESEYIRSLEDQGLILTQVDKFLIIRRFDPTEFGSIRYGIWTPKQAEGFTIVGNIPLSSGGTITNLVHYGLNMHVRNRVADPVYFDVSADGWYTGYTVENITVDTRPYPDAIERTDIWSLAVPITVGLSISPPLRSFPVIPHFSAGGGVAVGISSRHPITAIDHKRQSLESDAQFAPVWYADAGADWFFLKRIALSAALKYQSIVFHEAMYTGQTDLSGFRLMFGITFVP
jgi:hypothetical protein